MKTIEYSIKVNNPQVVPTELFIETQRIGMDDMDYDGDTNTYSGKKDVNPAIPGKITVSLVGTTGTLPINSEAGSVNFKYKDKNVFKEDKKFKVKSSSRFAFSQVGAELPK